MSTSELFVVAMGIIFLVPYLIWRLAKTDYYAPLVVVQVITGILFGPGLLGALYPRYYAFIFNPSVVQSLNGIASWAVMIFVWIAGIELDVRRSSHEGTQGGASAWRGANRDHTLAEIDEHPVTIALDAKVCAVDGDADHRAR